MQLPDDILCTILQYCITESILSLREVSINFYNQSLVTFPVLQLMNRSIEREDLYMHQPYLDDKMIQIYACILDSHSIFYPYPCPYSHLRNEEHIRNVPTSSQYLVNKILIVFYKAYNNRYGSSIGLNSIINNLLLRNVKEKYYRSMLHSMTMEKSIKYNPFDGFFGQEIPLIFHTGLRSTQVTLRLNKEDTKIGEKITVKEYIHIKNKALLMT